MNYTIIRAINLVLRIIEYAILARVIISWLPISRDNPLIRLLYQITEPILAPIRGIIQRSAFGRNMMLDFSPVVAFLLISLIRNIIFRLLLSI
jgi:YggT family protein